MKILLDAPVVLPLEVWGLAALGLALVLVAVMWLVQLARGRPQAESPAARVPRAERVKQMVDPVLVTPTAPRARAAAVDFDSQETLVPGSHVALPIEQIDLLSPVHDQGLASPERADPHAVATAKRRIAAAVARTGGPGRADNLTAIRGLSPVHARALHRLGLRSFAQLASLTTDEMQALAIVLSCPVEQIRSDDWVGQARAQQSP